MAELSQENLQFFIKEIASLNQRVTAVEVELKALREQNDARCDAQKAQTDARIDVLAQQVRYNHRELLLRLGAHHHGDGHYPVAVHIDPVPKIAGVD